jgi:hypothetical protein
VLLSAALIMCRMNEAPPRWLSVVKTPMIFNAFAILSISSIATAMAWKSSTPPLAWFAIGFIVVMTAWVNWQAKRDPRALMYGPSEYLEESRLEHERSMETIRQGRKQ